MVSIGNRVEITVQPGTNPEPDETELATLFYTDTSGIYFQKSNDHFKLRKLPGYQSAVFVNNQIITGAARSLESYRSTINHYIIGTNIKLYTYENGALYNITPFSTSSVAAANSIATDYVTLGSNPITTMLGARTVVIAETAHKLVTGSIVKIAGALATGGITAPELNTEFTVVSTTANNFTIITSGTAISNTTGGGSSVVASSAVLRITETAHGLNNGDRIGMSGASTTGGVPSTEINMEHIIRAVTANTFDVVASTIATSAVTAGGGADTIYFPPIPAGPVNYSQGFGYGGGLYGAGLYGTGKAFATAFSYPQIWSGGMYGNNYITTPGQQNPIYLWQNDLTAAPTILTNAPNAVTFVMIIGNFVLALGGSGVKNRVDVSDAGDPTGWTPGPASYAYEDDIEGAGEFISAATSKTTNLLFTLNEVYSFTFVDKPDIWTTSLIYQDDGIIGPQAKIEVLESVYIMGGFGFYLYDGSNFTKIEPVTCWEYIYTNLNYNAAYKSHCRHDSARNQIFFHFPLFGSSECNYYMIYHLIDGHCTLGKENSTAAERLVLQQNSPYTINADGTNPAFLYRRDIGYDADGSPLDWYAETNYAMIGSGDTLMEILEITPDATQIGNMQMTVYAKDYAQSTEEFTYPLDIITPTTTFIDPQICCRQRKYRFESVDSGEDFSMGKYFETVIAGTPL